MKTAYAYTKTCVGETAGGEVVSQQLEVIYRYAQEQGIEIVGEFRDLNIDASNEIKHRDELYALKDAATQNRVSYIIVEQPVRIAHDDVVRAVLLAILDGSGIRVLSALDGTNLTASEDQVLSLARECLPVYREFRRIWRPVVLRLARNRVRREHGRCEGAKPFGHYPAEQETLKRMLQLDRKPHGKPKRTYQAIADILNAEGRPTRRCGPWSKAVVHRIVKRHESQRLHAIK